MKTYVFDAGALHLLLLRDERLGSYVDDISSGVAEAYVSTVNLAELYYKTLEKLGREVAETLYFRILNSNLTISPADATLAKEAGICKNKYKHTLSLADCFAMALTLKTGALLLTTDRDFKEVKEIKVKHFPL